MVLALSLLASVMAVGVDCGPLDFNQGVLLFVEGSWQQDGEDLKSSDLVASRPEPKDGLATGQIRILFQDFTYIRECLGGECRETCDVQAPESSPAEHLEGFASALAMVRRGWASLTARPAMVGAYSRSTGFRDAIVGLQRTGDAYQADLADAFQDEPARRLRLRVCPVDPEDECVSRPYGVDWNGETALILGQNLQLGVFRIVEGEDESDAWIRFVPPEQLEATRTLYEASVRVLESQDLPASAAPMVQRLRRRFLLGVEAE